MHAGVKKIMAILALASAAYLWGGYSFGHQIWPMPQLRALKKHFFPAEEPTPSLQQQAERLRRLSDWPGKSDVGCPPQHETTAVLLIIGQSNAANASGQRYRSQHGPALINFFQGRCVIAGSPLLGSSGNEGESWTLLGDKLIASGRYQQVVLIPAAVGASEVARWAPGGDINALLSNELDIVHRHYRITHVLWHQGEADYLQGTSGADYRRAFKGLLETLRHKGVDAPVFVSVATKCGLARDWQPGNPVATAQRSLWDSATGVFPGVDTDSLLTETDRYDDCHFAGSGQEKFADAWLDAIHSLP